MLKPYVLTSAFFLLSGSVVAQSPDAVSMQSLVTEVRQLRVAVERLGSVMPQMQVTLQRMQLQQQRITDLARHVAELRMRLLGETAGQAKMAASVQGAEERLRETQDPAQLKLFQADLAGRKENLQQIMQVVQAVTTQEAEASAALRLEQIKLDELSERLNTLERSLDTK